MVGRMPDPMEFVRALSAHVFPKRVAGEVKGYANGIATVAVEGRFTNVQYSGTDDLKPGHKVWLRTIPDDPHGSYSYDGFRMQNGSISTTPGVTNGTVSGAGLAGKVVIRVRDGNNDITMPERKYLEFRGVAVTIRDDPAGDKIIIEIAASLGPGVDYDAAIDYDDPDTLYGG